MDVFWLAQIRRAERFAIWPNLVGDPPKQPISIELINFPLVGNQYSVELVRNLP